MKKIRRHLGEHLKPAKLFYDDIEDIVAILSDDGGEIEIEADDFKIDNLENVSGTLLTQWTGCFVYLRN